MAVSMHGGPSLPPEDPSLAYLRELLAAAEGNPALQQSILLATVGAPAAQGVQPEPSPSFPPTRRISLSGSRGARRASTRRASAGELKHAAVQPQEWPADARPKKSPERQIEIFIELARAYTWMHGRAHNRAASNAVITTAVVTLLSYISGGLALGASGTTYAASINLFAAILSLLVGAIASISKLKYFNFEGVAQQHAAMLRQWNKFISVSSTALAVPEEKQAQPLIDLLADLFPMWGELSSDSQEILPMWVRAECAVAFKRDNPKALVPMICKDAKKVAGVAAAHALGPHHSAAPPDPARRGAGSVPSSAPSGAGAATGTGASTGHPA